jgi:hypothetical protein
MALSDPLEIIHGVHIYTVAQNVRVFGVKVCHSELKPERMAAKNLLNTEE